MAFLGPGAFRALLAAAVVASHLSNLEIGRPAVFAFFALSGYWVTRMYDERYRERGVAAFYGARVLRIWLPFAAAYLMVVVLQLALPGTGDPGDLWSLGILGIATSGIDVLGVSWSLDIELQFYALVPLIWLALAGREPWRIAAVAFGSGLAALLGWWLLLAHGVATALAYAPAFAAGLIVWRTGWRPSGRTALFSAAAFIGAGALVWLLPETRGLLQKDVPTAVHEDWFGMAWVGLLVPFIARNVRGRSGALDRHLGNYSYSLYIVHWPVIWLMRQLLELGPAGGRVLALLAVAAVSVLFYNFIDRPCERLRQALVEGRAGPSPAPRAA